MVADKKPTTAATPKQTATREKPDWTPEQCYQNIAELELTGSGKSLSAAEFLRGSQGFPPAHTSAFVSVAKDQNCVVMTRVPGKVCEGLLAEGHDAKSFHIKAKSCNWGPMAGFLCLEPYMNKSGGSGAVTNLACNYKSLKVRYAPAWKDAVSGKRAHEGSFAETMPIEIAPSRIGYLLANKLLGSVPADFKAGDTHAFGAVQCPNGPSIEFLLVRNVAANYYVLYNPSLVHRGTVDQAWEALAGKASPDKVSKLLADPHERDIFVEIHQRIFAPRPLEEVRAKLSPEVLNLVKEKLPDYLPVQAMVNPDKSYEAGDRRNAITGDYDLFAIWPAQDSELDRRVVGMFKGITTPQIAGGEQASEIGSTYGNISERVFFVAQLLNSTMGEKVNRCFHSDEGGRPAIDAVDEAAVFFPNGNIYMIGGNESVSDEKAKAANAEALGKLVKSAAGLGFVPFLNTAWQAQLEKFDKDAVKFGCFGEGLVFDSVGLPTPPLTKLVDAIGKGTPAQREANLARVDREVNLMAREAQARAIAQYETQAVLSQVRVGIPDVRGPFAPKMQETVLSALASFKSGSEVEEALGRFTGTLVPDADDFFMLSPIQRDDLLDRVAFYRGMVVDHTQPEIIQTSYHDVLRRPSVAAAQMSEDSRTVPTKVLYRRPKFSGFFDNSYTSSEVVHQTQINGVSDVGFSLAAGGSGKITAGVGVGHAQSKESQHDAATVNKEVHTTTNYYLPKIEVAVDTSIPCAATAFVDAVSGALSGTSVIEQARAMLTVLHRYGHFVGISRVLGGRLFATQTKTLGARDKASDVSERSATELKTKIGVAMFAVEGQATTEKGDATQTKQRELREAQRLSVQSVGGEGSVLRDPALWAQSLARYATWSPVRCDGLFPSIDLLPADLRQRSWEVLARLVQDDKLTVQELLEKHNAHFMFYGAYAEKLGKLARKVWFAIAPGWDWAKAPAVLTIEDSRPVDRGVVKLMPFEHDDRQLWCMSAEGQLISRATNSNDESVEFALTVMELPDEVASTDGQRKFSTGKKPTVRLMQKGIGANQSWAFTASGQLRSTGIEPPYVLQTVAANAATIELADVSPTTSDTQLWRLIEEAELRTQASNVAAQLSAVVKTNAVLDDVTFGLLCEDGGLALTIRDAEAGEQSATKLDIVMVPDYGAAHQRWRFDGRNRLVSAWNDKWFLTAGPAGADCFLYATSAEVPASQRWAVSGTLKATGASYGESCYAKLEQSGGKFGVRVRLDRDSGARTQRFEIVTLPDGAQPTALERREVEPGVAQPVLGFHVITGGWSRSPIGHDIWYPGMEYDQSDAVIYSVDYVQRIGLPVNGVVRGVDLSVMPACSSATLSKLWGCLMLWVFTADGGWKRFGPREWYVEKNPEDGQLWDLQLDKDCQDIDTNPLYLPREGIAELAFQRTASKRLALAYKPRGGGEWVMNASSTPGNFLPNAAGSRVAKHGGVHASADEDVVGVQLYLRTLAATGAQTNYGYIDGASIRGSSGLGLGIRLLVVPKPTE